MDLTFKLYMKIQNSQLYESVVQTLHNPCMCTILHPLPPFDQSLHSFFLQTLALKQMILQHRQELVRHTVAH